MDDLTIPEASLYLLFLSANFEWDPVTNSIHGELPEKAEQFILKCINRLGLLKDIASQERPEEVIQKYNDLKDIFCTTTAEIIQRCAKPLLADPEVMNMVYYLCNEIVYLNGNIETDSKEEKYISKLNYYLKIDSSVSNLVYCIELLKNTLKS